MNITNVEQMYNEIELAALSLFEGGFINFGYWKNLDISQPISKNVRLTSERNLYRVILDKIIIKDKTILEVGCGQGVGTQFIFNHYKPIHITGLDFSVFQINKAQDRYCQNKINFVQASAERMPFMHDAFDAVVSIQTAHYFDSFLTFTQESRRVVKPDGQVAIATYFLKNNSAYDSLKKLIPTVNNHVEKPIAIESAVKNLKYAGFTNVTVESIGEFVWHGFDQWAEQLPEFKHSWGRNWYIAYQQNLVDYYIITEQNDL